MSAVSASGAKFPTGEYRGFTLKNEPDGDGYPTLTLADVAAMASDPQVLKYPPNAKPKDFAPWMIASTYTGFDARSATPQKAHGTYPLFVIDADEIGDKTFRDVVEITDSIAGRGLALIGYTTLSATIDRQKCRVIIPLSEAVSCEMFHHLQTALFEAMAEKGVICDGVMMSAAQLIYLPAKATPDAYYDKEVRDGATFKVDDVSHPLVARALELKKEQDEIERAANQEMQRRKKEREERIGKNSPPLASDLFSARNELTDVLAHYGYEPIDESLEIWIPRNSVSRSASLRIVGPDKNHWVSRSGGDEAAKIGRAAAMGRQGDGLDLRAFFDYENNLEAASLAYYKQCRDDGYLPKDGASDFATAPDDFKPTSAKDDFAPVEGDDETASGGDEDAVARFQASHDWALQAFPNAKLKIDQITLKGENCTALSANLEPVLDFDWVVEDVLSPGTISMIYGPSNTGKSFYAADIVAHVGAGRTWADCDVTKGHTVVLDLELSMFRNRLFAINQEKSDDGEHWAGENITLFEGTQNFTDDNDVATLLAALHERIPEIMEAKALKLLVVDTFSQAAPGADENSSKDVGLVIGNLKRFARLTGAAVLIIHHTGKDESKGARGSNSISAACETVFRITSNGTLIAERCRNTRSDFCFEVTSKVVQIGTNEKGKIIESRVIDATRRSQTAADFEDDKPASRARSATVTNQVAGLLLTLIENSPNGTATRDEWIAAQKKLSETRDKIPSAKAMSTQRDRALKSLKDQIARDQNTFSLKPPERDYEGGPMGDVSDLEGPNPTPKSGARSEPETGENKSTFRSTRKT